MADFANFTKGSYKVLNRSTHIFYLIFDLNRGQKNQKKNCFFIYRDFLFRKAKFSKTAPGHRCDNAQARAYTASLHIKGPVLKSNKLTWV